MAGVLVFYLVERFVKEYGGHSHGGHSHGHAGSAVAAAAAPDARGGEIAALQNVVAAARGDSSVLDPPDMFFFKHLLLDWGAKIPSPTPSHGHSHAAGDSGGRARQLLLAKT
jgi:hypothetical protein